MLILTDPASLSHALGLPIDLRLKQLLIDRRDQLGGDLTHIAKIIVVQGGDSLKALENELGFDLFEDADGRSFPDPEYSGRWEWLADHGHCFEMVFIFDDSGFAHVLLIQNSPMLSRQLRKLCLTFAT